MFKNIIKHPAAATIGGIAGTVLIPIPVLGTYLGAQIGAHIAHVRSKAGEATIDGALGTGEKDK